MSHHPHPQPKPHHRHTLASSDTMDTTPKSTHPKLRHHHNHPHPQPDPTILPPSTIQNISHRFSKLYANHKKIVQTTKQTPYGSTLKPQLPLHPEPDTDLQTKPICLPTVSDTKCTTLTKSNSQHERFNTSTTKNPKKEYYFSINSKVKGRNEVKKQSLHEKELKKGSQLICSDKIEEGFEAKAPSLSMVVVPPPLGNGGRRKSFCSSQVELADFLSCSGVKVVAVDMPPFMQIHAVDCARKTHDSLEKFTSKTLALTLKKEFDAVYGPAWHCIVGTSFGSFVTHSVGGFMYFSMDHKLYILLFKTTVQKAAE